jgi:hypothetical protein
MKNVTVQKNGTILISMEPDDAIDVAILEAMAVRASNNPAALRMTYADGVAVVSVEVK